MKKSLIAAAVAATLAGGAFAANVDVTGTVEAGVRIKMGNEAVGSSTSPSNNSANGWGLGTDLGNNSEVNFVGTEDLGNGLKAHFKFGIGLTSGETLLPSTLAVNKDLTVGLSGSFGSIKFGRALTPALGTTDFGDPSGYSTFGLSEYANNLGGGNGAYRINNALFYDQKVDNLAFGVSLAPADSDTSVASTSTASGTGSFIGNKTQRGIYAGAYVAYNGGALGLRASFQRGSVVFLDDKGNGYQPLEINLGGNYDLGSVKLLASFGYTMDAKNGKTTNGSYSNMGVIGGITAPINNAVLLRATLGFNQATNKAIKDVTITDNSFGLSVSMDYNLSKRTALIAGLTFENKTGNAKFNGTTIDRKYQTISDDGVGKSDNTSLNPITLGLGFRHNF